MTPLRFVPLSGLGELPKAEPLITGTFNKQDVVVVGGRKGVKKSFLVQDMACCVAAGVSWMRRTATQSPVVYIAAEGAGGLEGRFDAWKEVHPGADLDGMLLVPQRIGLAEGHPDIEELAQKVRAEGVGLVVVDTWARCFRGRENDNSDVNRAYDALDTIREAGATVLIVAHTTADDTKIRGATALEDNADVVYRMSQEEGHEKISLSRSKNKDGPEHDEMTLQLREVGLSCVLEPAGPWRRTGDAQ